MQLQDYFNQLNQNTNATLELAKSCATEKLYYKPHGRWSVIEILEHICIADKVFWIVVSRPSETKSENEIILGDKKINEIVVQQRNKKIEAPERLHPRGDIKDIEMFEKVFVQQRQKLKDDLTSGIIKLDNRIHKHPVLGEMTITDWLNFILHHTQRHLEQIKDTLK